MQKFSERDISFLFKAVAFSLLFMAFLHTISPLINPNRDGITEVSNSLVPLNAKELQLRFTDNGGKPTMLFIYTSWCGYCKQMVPELAQLMRDGQLDDYNVIMLSLDQKRRELGEYLLANHYAGLFTPYIFPLEDRPSLVRMLDANGSLFRGAIPYMAVFDRAGTLRDQDNKVISRARLQTLLGAAR